MTANPEDYTNRGTIITPLKDRIAAQILTHYPRERSHGVAIMEQEAALKRESPVQPRCHKIFPHIIEEIARAARTSEFVDTSSGVSARLTVAALETLVANAERRGLLSDEAQPSVHMIDLNAIIPAMTGKIELAFDGEQQGPIGVAEQLIGAGIRELWNEHLPSVLDEDERPIEGDDSPFAPILRWFAAGNSLTITDRSNDADYAAQLASVDGLMAAVENTLDVPKEEHWLWADFILEGLFWHGVLAREGRDGVMRYTDLLANMMAR